MLADKTGVLIATAARYGAMFSGASPEVVEAMTGYGERLGVAFQLADDLIDIASEAGESGKTPGTDLREGVPTLPVLLALRSGDPADARLHELLRADLRHDDACTPRRWGCCAVTTRCGWPASTPVRWAPKPGSCWRRCRRARPRRPCWRWWRGSSTASADPRRLTRSAGPEHGGRPRVPAAGCRWP